MPDGAYGRAIEDGVRQIAARLGVADFVYTVPQLAKGKGNREVADVLLISNERGAVLQVKTREPGSRSEEGAAWIASRGGGEKAYRQASGTKRQIRLLQEAGAPVTAHPFRAAEWSDDDRRASGLELNMDVSSWPTIIIVDHSDIDGTVPTRTDAFWITAEDWLWLNRALRSVTGLLIYVERILESEGEARRPLGHESERFQRMVEADAASAAQSGGWSQAWLTAEALEDPTGAQLYRELLERIWAPDRCPPDFRIEDVRRVLEFLDGVPPGLQVKIGRWILRKRSELSHRPWASGAVMVKNDRLLVFGCSRAELSEDLDRFNADLAILAWVRADEVRRQGDTISSVLAVGHLVGDGFIDYRYIYAETQPEVPEDMRRYILHRHGMLNLATGSATQVKAGRNDPCPCGSGLKFKVCEIASANI
jgi:SEC-C motif